MSRQDQVIQPGSLNLALHPEKAETSHTGNSCTDFAVYCRFVPSYKVQTLRMRLFKSNISQNLLRGWTDG